MHRSLGGVIPDDAVDHDLFFPAPSQPLAVHQPMESQAYLSLNQPFFPRPIPAVWVGLAGMRINEASPIASVKRP